MPNGALPPLDTPATKPRFLWILPHREDRSIPIVLRPSLPKGELPLWTPYVRGTLFPLNPLANETARFLWMLPSKKNDMSRKMLISFFFVEENRLSMNHLCQQSKEISERWLRLFLTRKSNPAFPFQ